MNSSSSPNCASINDF